MEKVKGSIEGLEVTLKQYVSEDVEEGHFESYGIEAMLDGNRVGILTLFVYKDYDGGDISPMFEDRKIEKLLTFEDFEVDENYQGKGIANEILKKLGELYREKFSGWPLFNWYLRPNAEYAVLNAVAKGWLPQEAFIEEYQYRSSYYYEVEQQIEELRAKLPEEYKGRFACKKKS